MYLIILLITIILLSAFASGISQHAHGLKEEIKVVSHSQFIDSEGFLHIVGEAENNMYGKVAKDIKVYSIFYDLDDEETITTRAAYAFIDNLRSGERSPFSIVVSDPSHIERIEGYQLTAISKNQSSISTALPADLKITVSENQLDESGTYHLDGKIVNYGSEAATQIIVAACFYNVNGTVIYTTYEYFPIELEATETLFFSFETSEINATSISYASVYAERSIFSSECYNEQFALAVYGITNTILSAVHYHIND